MLYFIIEFLWFFQELIQKVHPLSSVCSLLDSSIFSHRFRWCPFIDFPHFLHVGALLLRVSSAEPM